jgi:hypothetical protein
LGLVAGIAYSVRQIGQKRAWEISGGAMTQKQLLSIEQWVLFLSFFAETAARLRHLANDVKGDDHPNSHQEDRDCDTCK